MTLLLVVLVVLLLLALPRRKPRHVIDCFEVPPPIPYNGPWPPADFED